jgi:hypothetical protein
MGLGVRIQLHPVDLVDYFLVDDAQMSCGRFVSFEIGLIQAKKGGTYLSPFQQQGSADTTCEKGGMSKWSVNNFLTENVHD